MFYYKKDKNEYFLSGDTLTGEYGPFYGVYIKNKNYGKIDMSLLNLKKYPSYKYIYGVGKNYMFIVGGEGIVDLIPLENV